MKGFVKKFESDDREIYTKRDEIVAALGCKPGMAVADIGAGTGLFTRLFAEKVGPTGEGLRGRYLAPVPGAHRRRSQETAAQTHVVTVQGSQDSTNLPPESVDLVFSAMSTITWKSRTDARLDPAGTEPGGRLVVIDFDRVEGKSTAFVLKHVRASQEVFRKEIQSAGFVMLPRQGNAPRLDESFYLAFQKPGRVAKQERP